MQLNLNEYEAIAVANAVRSRGKALEKQTSPASQMELAANRSVTKKLKASMSQSTLFENTDGSYVDVTDDD